jgi:Chalcone isomerase-like
MKLPSFIAIVAFCSSVALNVTTVQSHELAGVSMPEVFDVSGRKLQLNGVGVGTKALFKVYVIGLYLEQPTRDAQTAITTEEAKRIVLTMLRDVSREKFVQAVEKGIIRNSGPAMPTLRARLDLLEQALPALKKGNVLDFTYLPGVGTLVRGQEREMEIPGKDFADALFSVWLGSEPSNAALKRQLLGG